MTEAVSNNQPFLTHYVPNPVYLIYKVKEPVNQLRTIQIIHLSFCISLLCFATVVILLTKDSAYFSQPFQDSQPINFIAPVFAILAVWLGAIMFTRTFGNTAQDNLKPESKIFRYQTAFLVQCAFLEAGALMNIVACLVTHNLVFLLFAAIPFSALLLNRPSKNRVYTILNIQDTDFF